MVTVTRICEPNANGFAFRVLKLASVQLLSEGTEQLWGAGDGVMQRFTFPPEPCLST